LVVKNRVHFIQFRVFLKVRVYPELNLNWIIFWFPFPKGLLICYRTKFGPCWAHNHMFFKWVQSLAMYSPPFFHPKLK
jgi:hypothetical protein